MPPYPLSVPAGSSPIFLNSSITPPSFTASLCPPSYPSVSFSTVGPTHEIFVTLTAFFYGLICMKLLTLPSHPFPILFLYHNWCVFSLLPVPGYDSPFLPQNEPDINPAKNFSFLVLTHAGPPYLQSPACPLLTEQSFLLVPFLSF